MSRAMAVEVDDPPTIVFREAGSGATWEWTPPLDLWLDMQAFAAASGLSIEEVINRALTDWLRKEGELEGE